MGIEPSFEGVSVNPILPPDAYPATAKLVHLGRERTIEISAPRAG